METIKTNSYLNSFSYTIEDIEKENNKRVVAAMCYLMWGNACAGLLPDYFGYWMVIAGEKLGYSAIIENLDKHFSQYFDKKLKFDK